MEMTLTAVCRALRNWFHAPQSESTTQTGTITIENWTVSPLNIPFIPGGYVRIIGSLLNDGIYHIGQDMRIDGALDETFTGTLTLLAIPRDFLELVQEIDQFVDANKKDSSAGQFTSESIGDYSYTRSAGKDGVRISWQEMFKTRLHPYRRMYEEVIP